MAAEGAAAYEAIVNEQSVGGVIVVIDKVTQHNHLDFLFVKTGIQSRGAGQAIWHAVEGNMLIDFNNIKDMTIPGMNNGTGTMTAKMYMSDKGKIIPTKIHPGGSIGMHKQDSGDDINYVLSGTGKAICDGVEEELKPDCCHVCPQGSEHSIINTGVDDLEILTFVVHR